MDRNRPLYYRQARTKKTKKKRIFFRSFILLTILLVGISSWGYWRYANALEPITGQITYTNQSQPITTPVAWPTYGQAAVATKEYGVLETHGMQTPAPTASTAKLITVLAVLESKRLRLNEKGPAIILTAKDVALYNNYVAQDGSVVAVSEGDEFSEYEMIQGILLASGNNLADSLAVWAFGSLENYTNYANQMIEAYGLRDTKVGVDASGLSPTTTSTAHDLAFIAQKAMKHPVIAEIVKQKQATLPKVGVITNTNWLLGKNDVVGLKTGNTDEAGGVFVLAANHQIGAGQNITIITVIMGAQNIRSAIEDSATLLATAKENLVSIALISPGQSVARFTMPWDSTTTYEAVSANAITGPVWKPAQTQPKFSLNTITGSQIAGTTVGHITFQRADGIELKSEIRLNKEIARPSIIWRILR